MKKIKYAKGKNGSYIHNCYIKRRVDDKSIVLFNEDEKGTDSFHLNGYAIVPLEDVRSIYLNIPINKKNIEEADKQLCK